MHTYKKMQRKKNINIVVFYCLQNNKVQHILNYKMTWTKQKILTDEIWKYLLQTTRKAPKGNNNIWRYSWKELPKGFCSWQV